MYHPVSKQRQLFTRIVVYSGMTIAVVFLVALLILYMLGYEFNQEKGTIQQSGLLQYVTTPNGATIEVDGATLGSKSPTKSTVLPGSHTVVMWREGYETWRKSQTVRAGTLTWLDYARLVPKQRPVETVAQLSKAASSLASPTGRFMAVLPDATLPVIDFYDLTADTVKQTQLTLTDQDYADAKKPDVTHLFEFVEWDKGGRYLLLKHTHNGAVEWLIVDRSDNTLQSNITATMDIPISDVHFSGTSGLLLFVLTGSDVRKVNLGEGTLSRPLASNVAEFNLYGTDLISYVTTYDEVTGYRTVGIVRDSDKEPIVLRHYVGDKTISLHVMTTRYFNQDFVVIGHGKNVSVLSGEFPDTTKTVAMSLFPFASFAFDSDIQWLQVSASGRFVVAQNGAKYVSYDLERKVLSPTATLAGSSEPKKLRWLDNYYVWSDGSDTLTMREFDGANEHAINAVAPGFDATLNPSEKYLYSIGKVGEGYQLQRVKMILN